jgi:integrase
VPSRLLRRLTDHRRSATHVCDDRCRPHVCRPLTPSTVRQIHWILSGALERAVRWHWISVNPSSWAKPPSPPRPNPRPPSVEDAARISLEAWRDPDWGTYVWLAMTVGLRRGEQCALRRRNAELDAGVLSIEESLGGRRSAVLVKDTKTHQMRRAALDAETVEIIRELIARQDERARHLGVGPTA